MIKNIILDVGRVLVAWNPKEGLRKLGFDEKTADAIADATVNTSLWNETDRGVWPEEKFMSAFYENAPELKEEIALFWEKIDLSLEQFPYAKQWISDMKQQGFHIYILSNYSEKAYEKTKDNALDFLPLVDGAVFSYTVKLTKPDKAIYETLLNRYQLNADECVFIDDLPANVEGAKSVGLHGICFETLEQVKEDLKKYGVNV